MAKIHECTGCHRSFNKEETAARAEAPGTKGLTGLYHFCAAKAAPKAPKGKHGKTVANVLTKADGERILAVLAGMRSDITALQASTKRKATKVTAVATDATPQA